MTDRAVISRPGRSISSLVSGAIVAVALTLPAASPLSADQVVLRGDNFGQDLAFIDRFLGEEWSYSYGVEPGEGVDLLTLDDVFVGRYDVNGDGQDELFVQAMVSCGSVGCPTYVFEQIDGHWAEIAGVSGFMGGEMDV